MEEVIFEWLFLGLAICLLVSALGVGITNAYFGGKHLNRFGATSLVKFEDCEESKRMLLGFIEDALHEQKRRESATKVGCSGPFVLMNSKEIAILIKKVHETGGRLVLRKVSDCDIECPENTVLDVKKQLSEMDIRRAKKYQQKKRR